MVSEYFIKAKANLAAAKICYENKLFDASISRAYFAAFQAAIAALLHSGECRGKFDHKWVQAKFTEKLIKRRKIFPKRFRSYLIEMQGLRNAADYRHEPISQKKTAEQLRKSADIVSQIGEEFLKC